MTRPFRDEFETLFKAHFPRIFRYLDRFSGDPDLAADLTQETFMKLYRRGAPPEVPEAWLITVANNLLRNAHAKRTRQARLLTEERALDVHSARPVSPAQAGDTEPVRQRVRSVLDRLPEREKQLLLLRAEGYSYHDLATALELSETSVGTLLARAKRAFRDVYEESGDAS